MAAVIANVQVEVVVEPMTLITYGMAVMELHGLMVLLMVVEVEVEVIIVFTAQAEPAAVATVAQVTEKLFRALMA
jgi:hypothetical protein